MSVDSAPSASSISDPPDSTSLSTIVIVKQISADLNNFNGRLLKVQPAVSAAYVATTQLDGFVSKVLSFLHSLEQSLTFLHDGLTLLKYLGPLIPVIGDVLSEAATNIEALHLDTELKKFLDNIRGAIQKAKNDFLDKLKTAACKVSTKLDSITTDIPIWTHTMTVLASLFGLVEMLVGVVGANTDLGKKVTQQLTLLTHSISDSWKDVSTAFDFVENFVQVAWDKFKQTILDTLNGSFAAFITTMQPFFAVMKDCLNILDGIEDAFKPVFWLLDAVSWLFEHTIGALVKWVEEEFGVDQFFHSLIDKIKAALGINTVEEQLQCFFNDALSGCCDALENCFPADGKSIIQTAETFGHILLTYNKDPAGALIQLITQALAPDPSHDPSHAEGPIKLPFGQQNEQKALQIPRPMLLLSAGPAIVSEDVVEQQQASIGIFINSLCSSPAPDSEPKLSMQPNIAYSQLTTLFVETAAQSTVNTNMIMPPQRWVGIAPKLNYATYNNDSVSVLLRTTHPVICDTYSTNLQKDKTVSGSQSQKEPSSLPKRVSITTDRSKPGFSLLTENVNSLHDDITEARSLLLSSRPGLAVLDSALGSFDSQSTDFAGHLLQMLNSMDPVIDTAIGLTQLPFQYQTALLKLLQNTLDDDTIGKLVVGIFDALRNALQTLPQFQKSTAELIAQLTAYKTTYIDYSGRINSLCTSSISAKSYGQNIQTLTNVVDLIDRRLVTVLSWFSQAVAMADTAFGSPTIDLRTHKQLDDTCTMLAGKAEKLSKQIDAKQGSSLTSPTSLCNVLGSLQASADAVYKDIQVFFRSAVLLSNECSTAESKVIAVDQLNTFCAKINSIISPLQAVLDAMGVPKDSVPVTGPAIPSATGAIGASTDSTTPNDPASPSPAVLTAPMMVNLSSALQGTNLQNLFTEVLPDLVAMALPELLKRYLAYETITDDITELSNAMSNSFSADIEKYQTALANFLLAMGPIQTATMAGNANSTAQSKAAASNLLFDDSLIKELQSVLGPLNEKAGPAKDGKLNTAPAAKPSIQ